MFRSDFPMLKEGLLYFDNAATTQKPRLLLDTLTHFYAHQYGTVHRAVYRLAREATDAYHGARRHVQRFLHAAHPEEIVFTRGTTASLNLLARSYTKAFLSPGVGVLISEIEHHANLVPWQMMREEAGILLRILPVDDEGTLRLDLLEDLLRDGKVKLVSLAHLSHITGTIHPVEKIISLAHAYGAHVALDGAQAAAHLPLDVQELDVDFYTFSGHKVYGPTGIGILYGKKALLNQMPPLEGGGDMIETVSLEKSTYTGLPTKFEAGTPMIAEAIGLGAVLAYLMEIGLAKIARWEKELVAYLLESLSSLEGIRLIGNGAERGPIVSFTVEGTHPLDIASGLDCRGICVRSGHQCSQPAMHRFGVPGVVRLSFGLYNTREEIDLFLSELSSLLPLISR